MTKLLEQAYTDAKALPDEAQDAVARRLMEDVEAFRAKVAATEAGLRQIEDGEAMTWDEAKSRLKERRNPPSA